MPAELLVLCLGSLLAVGLMRSLPKPHAANAVAALSFLLLCFISWVSAAWLLLGCIMTLALMALGETRATKTSAFVVATTLHLGTLLALRDMPMLVLVGGAYFTLRHIHVLSDWWAGDLDRPAVGDYLRYQFFLPVLAAGPIHRFAAFRQQLMRRRNDIEDLATGAERLLWGAFQFTVLGGWLMSRVEREILHAVQGLSPFLQNWFISAENWITLYLTFAGLTSMAVGLALMMGLRIEENFNAPWRASNLVDFWRRWHMSLTSFSRDYIFRPVSAMTRSTMAGAFAALLFLGLWHGSSVYWLGWGIWQGAGVLLTAYGQRSGLFSNMPRWSGRLFAALWLCGTLPMVSFLTGATP